MLESTMRVKFSQMSIIYSCWGFSFCLYNWGVCNIFSKVSARGELTVMSFNNFKVIAQYRVTSVTVKIISRLNFLTQVDSRIRARRQRNQPRLKNFNLNLILTCNISLEARNWPKIERKTWVIIILTVQLAHLVVLSLELTAGRFQKVHRGCISYIATEDYKFLGKNVVNTVEPG